MNSSATAALRMRMNQVSKRLRLRLCQARSGCGTCCCHHAWRRDISGSPPIEGDAIWRSSR